MADYKDKLLHVLADMENLRDRTTRQAEQSRSFAIQVDADACQHAQFMYGHGHSFMAFECIHSSSILQGFVKSLLDVADNLERAAGSVTDQSLQGLNSNGKALTAKQSSKLLKGLLEGVHLTDRILLQVRRLSAQIGSQLV